MSLLTEKEQANRKEIKRKEKNTDPKRLNSSVYCYKDFYFKYMFKSITGYKPNIITSKGSCDTND